MTQTIETPSGTDAEPDEAAEGEGRGGLGRALDIAGIAAGVVLGVILFDVLSGGKLTRWAQRKRGQAPGPAADGKPCEGCDDA